MKLLAKNQSNSLNRFSSLQRGFKLSVLLNFLFIVLAMVFVMRRGGIPYLIDKLSFLDRTSQQERNRTQKEYRQNTYRTSYHGMKTKIFSQLPNAENEIVFLGDSLTDQGEWAELLKNSHIVNRGISGNTTEGILVRLDEVIESKPKKIFLLIGTNDFWNEGKSVDEVLQRYRTILTEIAQKTPDTKVYLQSILPVNTIDYNPRIDNQKLSEFNPFLEKLAAEFSYQYIDLYPHFLDENQQLNREYTTDGVHLNGKGYILWKNLIERYVND